MTEILILTAAVPLLAGLLWFEKKESARGLLLTKPFLSLLFIAVALTGPGSDPTYFGLILAFATRYQKDIGVGTLIAMMLPYSVIFFVGWTALFFLWVFGLGLPVGPGAPTYYTPG